MNNFVFYTLLVLGGAALFVLAIGAALFGVSPVTIIILLLIPAVILSSQSIRDKRRSQRVNRSNQ